MTEMPFGWFDVALGAGLVVSIALIVYVWLKNRELAKTVLEEKNAILGYLVPFLEAVVPYLPPDKQAQAKEALEALKLMYKINEALLQVPVAKLRKAWLAQRAQLRK